MDLTLNSTIRISTEHTLVSSNSMKILLGYKIIAQAIGSKLQVDNRYVEYRL